MVFRKIPTVDIIRKKPKMGLIIPVDILGCGMRNNANNAKRIAVYSFGIESTVVPVIKNVKPIIIFKVGAWTKLRGE